MSKKTFVTFLVGVICFSVGVADESEQPSVESNSNQKTTIRLVFDYSDGAKKVLTNVPWKSKMTLGQAMEFATAHKHGVKLKRRGSGSTGFIEKIDDLENQGAKGPNWIFRVNGKLGDRSYGVTTLNPGDTVLWKFDTYP
jgi:hypothetical protein